MRFSVVCRVNWKPNTRDETFKLLELLYSWLEIQVSNCFQKSFETIVYNFMRCSGDISKLSAVTNRSIRDG